MPVHESLLRGDDEAMVGLSDRASFILGINIDACSLAIARFHIRYRDAG
jgi:hypothetical protein